MAAVPPDTLLPQGALQRINTLEPDVSVQAGLLSFLNNVRCRWTKVIYGAQAMFVRRALFEQ